MDIELLIVNKVSEQPESERLLAEALRAQAARTPLPESNIEQADDHQNPEPLGEHTPPTTIKTPPHSWNVGRTVLFALILGLAVGVITGLATVL